jgi:hypothetical protein
MADGWLVAVLVALYGIVSLDFCPRMASRRAVENWRSTRAPARCLVFAPVSWTLKLSYGVVNATVLGSRSYS